MKLIKYVLFTFLMGFCVNNILIAQDNVVDKKTCRVLENHSDKEDQFFLEAIERANMESYRLKTKDVEITFKEGVKCILFSASKLSAAGQSIDEDAYQEKFRDGFSLPIFSVHSNGNLLAAYPKKRK